MRIFKLLLLLLPLTAFGSNIGMPSIITVSEEDRARFSYFIPVVYLTEDGTDLLRSNDFLCKKLNIDFKVETLSREHGFKISSKEELTILELSRLFNSCSRLQWTPNWTELHFLSADKVEPISTQHLSVVMLDEKSTAEFLIEKGIKCESDLIVPRGCMGYSLQFSEEESSVVTINSRGPHCMDHDRYSVRLFDVYGRITWEYEKGLLGDISLFRIHNGILIIQKNHGDKTSILITKKESNQKLEPAE